MKIYSIVFIREAKADPYQWVGKKLVDQIDFYVTLGMLSSEVIEALRRLAAQVDDELLGSLSVSAGGIHITVSVTNIAVTKEDLANE